MWVWHKRREKTRLKLRPHKLQDFIFRFRELVEKILVAYLFDSHFAVKFTEISIFYLIFFFLKWNYRFEPFAVDLPYNQKNGENLITVLEVNVIISMLVC